MHTKPTCGENNESTDFPSHNYVFFQRAGPSGSVLRVRIPHGDKNVCLLRVSVVCCQTGLCDGPIIRRGESYRMCVCHLNTVMTQRRPNRAVQPGGGEGFSKFMQNVRIFRDLCGHNYTT